MSESHLDGLTDSKFRIQRSEFHRSGGTETEEVEMTVKGRIDTNEPFKLSVRIELAHSSSSAGGRLTGALTYQWSEQSGMSEGDIVEFAAEHAVPAAFYATAGLFSSEFKRLGVNMSFPPPNLPRRLADAIVEGYEDEQRKKGDAHD